MYNLYLDKLYLAIFIYSNNRSWWRSLFNSLSNFISFIWGVPVSVFVQTPNPKPELRVLVINIWVIKIDWVRGGGGQDWDRSTCQCQSLSPPVHQQHHYLSLLSSPLSSVPSHQPDHHSHTSYSQSYQDFIHVLYFENPEQDPTVLKVDKKKSIKYVNIILRSEKTMYLYYYNIKNGIYFDFHQFFYFIWFNQDFRVSYDARELNKDKHIDSK